MKSIYLKFKVMELQELNRKELREITGGMINKPNPGLQDGSTKFYDPVRKFLGLTGDLLAFNTVVSQDAVEVTMTFIPE